MTPASPPKLSGLLEMIAIAAIGGALLGLPGLPAGWLSGAILLTSAAAIFGRPLAVPDAFMKTVFIAMGIISGAVVTPETLRGVATWPLSIVAMIATLTCSTFAGFVYLRRVHGWNAVSAMLATMPGSLPQVIIHATEEKAANLPGIAMVQSIRSAILSFCLPVGLALVGVSGVPPQPSGAAFGSPAELVTVTLVSTLVALLFQKIRFPGGVMVGAMVASGVLYGSGLIHAHFPGWVLAAVSCLLGGITGSRFSNINRSLLVGYLFAGVGLFAVTATVAVGFAVAVASALAFQPGDVIMAFMPGASDVMILLALALHLDPVFVGAHHICRIIVVSLSMPAAVRLTRPASADRP